MPVEEVETVNTNIGKLRGPERFFHSTWHTFLKKRLVRICVVSVFALVAIVGIVLASTPVQLTKTVLVLQILKKSHPLQKTFDLLTNTHIAFKKSNDGFKATGYMVYGLDVKSPIDRSGTNPLGDGPSIDGDQNDAFEDLRGVARYNGQDLTSETFQQKVVEDYIKIEKLSSVLRKSDSKSEVWCFMWDFNQSRAVDCHVRCTSRALWIAMLDALVEGVVMALPMSVVLASAPVARCGLPR